LAQIFDVEVVKVKTSKGEFSFKTEMAVSATQRQRGLMFRKSMNDDAAMMFQWYKPQPISMWMKNTYISLDIVFIHKNGRVANVAAGTIPHSLQPVFSKGLVSAVLELKAGMAGRIGLAEGDLVSHRFFETQK